MTTTTVSVCVAVDSATAFTAFTEELDQCWVRGPVNYFDFSRAIGTRCEPGVGGRLVEVYDEATGDGLELGLITVWEPGVALAWKSSLDDVEISVRFTPVEAGTVLRSGLARCAEYGYCASHSCWFWGLGRTCSPRCTDCRRAVTASPGFFWGLANAGGWGISPG